MKSILTILCLCAIAVAGHAQQYNVTALYSTNNVAKTNGSASPNAVLGVTKFEDVAIELSAAGATAAMTTNTLTATFAKSADGSTYETTGSLTVTLVGDGVSATNYVVTTANVGAAGYLRLNTIAWNGTTTLVHAGVRVARKPARFGN